MRLRAPASLVTASLFAALCGCARLPLLTPSSARQSTVQRSCLGKGPDVPEPYRGECVERTCEQSESGKVTCAYSGGEERNRELLRLLRVAADKEASRRQADEQAQRRACADGQEDSCKSWYDRSLEEWSANDLPSLGVIERRRVTPTPSEVLATICGMPAWRCRFHDEPTDEKSGIDRMTLQKSGVLTHEITRRGVIRRTDIEPAAAAPGAAAKPAG